MGDSKGQERELKTVPKSTGLRPDFCLAVSHSHPPFYNCGGLRVLSARPPPFWLGLRLHNTGTRVHGMHGAWAQRSSLFPLQAGRPACMPLALPRWLVTGTEAQRSVATPLPIRITLLVGSTTMDLDPRSRS